MKKWFNIIGKYKIALAVLFLTTIAACSKSNNPFNLPEADPSQYTGGTNDGIIRILSIGNSFSEDALEANLYELAKEKGITVIIGNMYIGSASLEQHKTNIQNNASVYSYRKIGKDGVRKIYNNVRLDVAVDDEQWDYVSFQQVSQNSGQLETIQASLPAVFNYVKSKVKNPKVKYVYHQTWAYAQTSTHEGFANYNRNQMTMYNAIVNVSQKVKEIVPVDIIVPAGTAIQTGRTSAIEDGFTRDGYHLNPLGRYTAACTWFETLFNQSTVGMTYKTEGLGNFEASVAQNAAHFAVLKPYEVTEMTNFQGEGGPLANPVFIAFGKGTPIPAGWNQVGDFQAGARANLKDNTGKEYIGLSLSITERFNSENTGGATATTTAFNMPSSVSSRSYFGNTKRAFGGIIVAQSKFVISGLDKNLTYNLGFFGSRAGVADNRETKYIVAGSNNGEASLNTSANSTNIVYVNSIKPADNGKITVTVTAGPNNNSADGFYYLNAVRLTSN
ncbi:DUF4886 domain-containing protein [Pedobacter heparinus]|uniref:DUF4886 domain-containing protein n=1 Tax=Pedobacter heparinus TaxID=984 RepID=UPI0029313349|nr:DUF4886 domain-containing protein [Pedobacter heparinus]